MAGTLIISNLTTDTDNTFIVRSNTGTTLFSANTTGIDIANSIGATAITSDKILSVANTKISGNIASSQIAPDQTLYGNVSVTGTLAATGAGTFTSTLRVNGGTSGFITIAAPAVSGSNTITMPATTGTMAVLPASPSMVRLYAANGYGSTNTVIRRFTTTVTNQGSDITYADSATLGATFTINTAGIYAISSTDCFNVAGSMGISLNSNQLTTVIYSIAQSNILAVNQGIVNSPVNVCWTGALAASDVIRSHSTGSATGTNGGANSTFFTIVRVQ